MSDSDSGVPLRDAKGHFARRWWRRDRTAWPHESPHLIAGAFSGSQPAVAVVACHRCLWEVL